jgi:hypothetical protein
VSAKEPEKHLGKEVKVPGYLITTRPVYTVKNETMYFYTFIDAVIDWLHNVFFPQVANCNNANGKGFYSMKVK